MGRCHSVRSRRAEEITSAGVRGEHFRQFHWVKFMGKIKKGKFKQRTDDPTHPDREMVTATNKASRRISTGQLGKNGRASNPNHFSAFQEMFVNIFFGRGFVGSVGSLTAMEQSARNPQLAALLVAAPRPPPVRHSSRRCREQRGRLWSRRSQAERARCGGEHINANDARACSPLDKCWNGRSQTGMHFYVRAGADKNIRRVFVDEVVRGHSEQHPR